MIKFEGKLRIILDFLKVFLVPQKMHRTLAVLNRFTSKTLKNIIKNFGEKITESMTEETIISDKFPDQLCSCVSPRFRK